MHEAAPAWLATWRHSLPSRWRHLLVPYGQAMGTFVAGYTGATALLRPWALGGWWSVGVPLAAGFGVCWWLWRPWALLARNYKGESRRLPLYFTWILLVGLGYGLRQGLYAQLGQVRDLRSPEELMQPGTAVFFRLHGPFYLDRLHAGHYATTDFNQSKNGTKSYYADCFYACPLLAAAADTALAPPPVPAWLGYTYREALGNDLSPGELNWRYVNSVARSDARFDTLVLDRFTYLARPETSAAGFYRAAQNSRLASRAAGTPLLLLPEQTPFAKRGLGALALTLVLTCLGSVIIIFLLLVMELRPLAS